MNSAHVLVVMNNNEERAQIVQALKSWKHQITTVSDGAQALNNVKQTPFDIVLIHHETGGINSVEMVRQIVQYDPTLTSLIIAPNPDHALIIQAMESGAKGFLPSPFTPEELKEKFDLALEKRNNSIENRLLIGELLRNRNKLYERIAEREAFLNQLINAAPFAIYATGEQGQILTFNRKAEELYAFTLAEILGNPVKQLWQNTAPNLQKRQKTHAIHRKKNGQTFPVSMQCCDIQNTEGNEIAHLYIVEDLSEREKMEDQLLYAERLSLLGQLAPRIAHEFKTPIQLISGQAELATMYLQMQKVEKAQECISQILPSSQNILNLVKQMLNLGKPAEHCEKQLNLVEELEKTLDPLQHLGTVKYCQIKWDIADPIPNIKGDPTQIEQVFRNLIVNAAQAMEQSKTERKLTFRIFQHKKDPFLVVQIEDSGPGISQSDLTRIFQPFFTTKPEGKGTGLGLAIVKSILDRHNAYIDVHSEEGKGTLFTLSFPICTDKS